MSKITFKILMKSGTFGLYENVIEGFFFAILGHIFFFGQRILRNLILFQFHFAPLGRAILKNAKRLVK